MDSTELRARALARLDKTDKARDEAHAKYDTAVAQVPLPPNLAALEKIKYEADVAFARATRDLVIAQGITGDALEAAKDDVARADRELDKLTSAAAAPSGLSSSSLRLL